MVFIGNTYTMMVQIRGLFFYIFCVAFVYILYIYKLFVSFFKRFICPGGEEAVGPCPVAPADRNILYENRLLGLPR